MTKTKKFLLLSFLLVASRFFDVFTTYLYIPDLRGETNVLVRYLGAGWLSVIIVQTLVVALIIYSLYYYLFRFQRIQPEVKNLSRKEYISFIHFNDTHSFDKLFLKLPKNKNVLLATLGFIATYTLIAAGFVVGTSTLFLLISNQYRQVYSQGIPTLLYVLIVLLAGYFSVSFYNKEYKTYKAFGEGRPH